MDVYVGMDVHRKRSQVAVLDARGTQLLNRNLPNDPAELLPDAPEPLPPPPIEATPDDPGGDPGGVPEPA